MFHFIFSLNHSYCFLNTSSFCFKSSVHFAVPCLSTSKNVEDEGSGEADGSCVNNFLASCPSILPLKEGEAKGIEEDFLDVDPPVRGQGYVCLSFLSPEDFVLKREGFFAEKFLQTLLQKDNL